MNDFVKRISGLSQKQLIVLAARLQEKLELQAKMAASQSKEAPKEEEKKVDLGKQFVVNWEEVTIPDSTINAEKPWLVVAWDDTEAGLWEQVLTAKEQPHAVITAESLGLTNLALSAQALEDGLASLKEAIAGKTDDTGANIIYTWPAALAASEAEDEPLHKVLAGGLLTALKACDSRAQFKVWQITKKGVAVKDKDPVLPIQGPVLGLGKVAALEATIVWGGTLDVAEVDAEQIEKSLALVSWCKSRNEDLVALRDGKIYTPRLCPSASEGAPTELTIDSDGTYLITGGSGGLGLATAEKLAEKGARHIVLLSRSGLARIDEKPKLKELLDRIKGHGAEVTSVQADVADNAAMSAVIADVTQNMPPLKGVVLAAGASDACMIYDLTPQSYWEMVRSKVVGAKIMHNLIKDFKDCFLVAFSSIASVWGSAMGGAYSAANAYLDALGAYRRSLGLHGLVINWGPWGEIGMSTGQQATFLARAGLRNLKPQEAIDYLAAALADPNLAQSVVTDVDWEKFIELQEIRGEKPFFGILKKKLGMETGVEGDGDGSLPPIFAHLADADSATRKQEIRAFVTRHLRTILELDESELLRTNQPLHEFGVDSLLAVQLRNTLRKELRRALPSTLVFDYPTIDAITGMINSMLFEGGVAHKTELAQRSNANEPIAVIGIGCRFPGDSEGAEKYWQMLVNGVDAIDDSPERWDVKAYKSETGELGKAYTLSAGMLDRIDTFDAAFFGISPREAKAMDPQQRLVLEVSWHGLEDAGYANSDLEGSQTGVYIGVGPNEYMAVSGFGSESAELIGHLTTGNNLNVIAGRVSYVLGLRGPSMAIDTACSSSLVALHTACQGLRLGDCNMAIAGGVNTLLTPESYLGLCSAQFLSPKGRCYTFDASADGYTRGEGAGVLILKRLSDAQRDGDNILAVIRGSSVNQDGRSSSLTAPNGPAQQDVIRRALANAGLSPADIDFVETHGTGTALGDPIELHALEAIYGSAPERKSPLVLGAVKTNIGHLESASAVAGLIKVILSMQHDTIPPNLHFKEWNPNSDVNREHFIIPTTPIPWARAEKPRIGAISSFGFSGTNAHMIVEEAPVKAAAPATPEPAATTDRPAHLLALSARSTAALDSLAVSYGQYLSDTDLNIADIAFSANTGRSHFNQRMAVVGEDNAALSKILSEIKNGAVPEDGCRDKVTSAPQIAFMFTGQGAQYGGMGKALYDADPQFKSHIEKCSKLLEPRFGFPIEALLWGDKQELIQETRYTQPLMYVLQTGILNFLRRIGITPSAVLGHSVGEFAAAHASGIFSLEQGLELIAARGALMWDLCPQGAMIVVFDVPEKVQAFVEENADKISIATFNSPRNTVVAGDPEKLEELSKKLAKQNIKTHQLRVSHGFHSVQMAPMLEPFAEEVAKADPQLPHLAFYSTVTAQKERELLAQPSYWVDHVKSPVNFKAAIAELANSGVNVLIEIGPGATLTTLGQMCVDVPDALWLNTQMPQREWDSLLHSVAQLYVRGADINWRGLDAPYGRKRVHLPCYPFQRKRFWSSESEKISLLGNMAKDQGDPILGRRMDLSRGETIFETLYTWKRPFLVTDHKLYEVPVVPGASHLAMVVQAALRSFNGKSVEFQDVVFPQPMIIPNEEIPARSQYAFKPEKDEFKVVAQSCQGPGEDPSDWQTHLTASIKVLPEGEESKAENIPAELVEKATYEHKGEDHYNTMWAEGYQLLEGFRWIDHIWADKGWSIARMKELGRLDAGYVIPPGFLDSCFQSSRFSFGTDNEEDLKNFQEGQTRDLYIPFAIDRLILHREPKGELWCLARSKDFDRQNLEVFTSDLWLLDAEGNLVAEIQALRGKRAPRNLLLPDEVLHEKWVFSTEWRPAVLDETVVHELTKPWMVLGEDQSAQLVANALQENGIESVGTVPVVEAADRLAESEKPVNLVYLVSGDMGIEAEYDASRAFLELVKTVLQKQSHKVETLWMVTRAAHAAAHAAEPVNPVSRSIWSVAGVLANELPDMPILRLDVAADLNDTAIGATLVSEARHHAGDDLQIAYRHGRRFVARIAELAKSRAKTLEIPAEPFKVQLTEYGTFDNLTLVPMERRAPGSNQVEIQVQAAEMNLKETLACLGMLQEYVESHGVDSAKKLPFGVEFTGRVVRVGEDVEHLKPGDRVLAAAPGCMASYAVTPVETVIKLPENVSLDEAAALPTAYLTAYYGLVRLAHMKQGEKILIHAAAGGVGQAAVLLSHHLGLEVYATASPGKWAHLRAQGVKHIYNSRTLDFSEAVLADTDGQGVDLVLNSLNGDFIPKSIDCLAKGGRFVDIGKIGLWTNEQFQEYRADAEYITFDWADVMFTDLGIRESMLSEILPMIAEENMGMVPTTVFPIQDIGTAYRYLASAKNIGRLVLRLPQHDLEGVPQNNVPIKADATYIITGGLGALGLRTAEWLAQEGAKHLVLTSRSGNVSEKAAPRLEEIGNAGTQVSVRALDITDEAQVKALFAEFAAGETPIKGIVHAAGALEDGTLQNMEWDRFERVLSPKVNGTWNIHLATLEYPVEFFICYSSTSVILCSPGQSNYVAANAFMDGLMQYRRSMGLHGVAIGWGAWSGDGMASQLSEQDHIRYAAVGIGMLPEDSGMDTLRKVVSDGRAAISVVPIDANQMARAPLPPAMRSYFSELGLKGGLAMDMPPAAALKPLVDEAPKGKEVEVICEFLRNELARVLGLGSGDEIGDQDRLFDLGLDSLMAVELRNRLQFSVGERLPATILFDYPTIVALAEYIASVICPDAVKTQEVDAAETAKEEELKAVEDEISELSDEEAEAELLKELNSLGS